MTKFIVGVIAIVITAGLLWPLFQPVRESNCGPHASVAPTETAPPAASSHTDGNAAANDSNSWPNDVLGLVEHLNQWHADELLVYNEPDQFPNRVPSGETGGWITAHVERIKKLGANVEWDKQQKRYVVAH